VLIENGALDEKWLSKADAARCRSGAHGDNSPGWLVPSSHLTVAVVVTRFASFCGRQVIGEPIGRPGWYPWTREPGRHLLPADRAHNPYRLSKL